MADGSVSISITADDADAQKKLQQLRKDIEKTEKAINTTTEKRNGISEALQDARIEAERTEEKIHIITDAMAAYKEILSFPKFQISRHQCFPQRKTLQRESGL